MGSDERSGFAGGETAVSTWNLKCNGHACIRECAAKCQRRHTVPYGSLQIRQQDCDRWFIPLETQALPVILQDAAIDVQRVAPMTLGA